MIADAAVDQGNANSRSAIVRLPCEWRVDRAVGVDVRGRQGTVGADVHDIRVVRKALNAIAIENRNQAIDQRQISENRAAEFDNVIQQTIDEAEQSAAVQLGSRGILNDDLRLLRR